jgi:hypothetical protein
MALLGVGAIVALGFGRGVSLRCGKGDDRYRDRKY